MAARGAAGGRLIRVIYLVSTLRRAGPTSQLLNILAGLDRARIRPVVVTLSPEPADSMIRHFEASGTPVRTLGLSRLRALVRRRWRSDILGAAAATAEDRVVVHSQGVRADVVSARWLGGLARVATARNYPFDDYPLKFGRLPGLWLAHSHIRAFRRLPQVVACSATLAARLRAHGIEADVILNGVDTARFRPASAQERAQLRAGLGLPAAASVGVSVGALSARKDPLAIVRAFRAVAGDQSVLVFLGDGPLREACRSAASGDERVRFAGEVADVAGYLRAADYLVSASHSEGLPNAVLEALACGLRVVVTDIGPHRELLELVPGSGESFPVGDTGALSACLARAAGGTSPPTPGEPPGELLGAGRMARSYEALYRRLAGEGTGP